VAYDFQATIEEFYIEAIFVFYALKTLY